MKFDKLRLVGFKSFVEPTDFDIRPGLTGIVGPNGCGKSNLLEALRWVMGATSAKALRGGGMEDVIFAGTNSRPARSWAEVTLALDNTARTLPAEFNECPELEVTRRITRKPDGAQSDYRINGRPVRAKDVQLLFADAATGANSPALVRQGQIAELIESKPQNRRKLLEEAAGITGLHARRHESELRLRAADANLERLDDVTAELDTQRAGLARQARQAKRYRTLSAHIRQSEAMVAYLRWHDACLARDDCAGELAVSREALEQLTRAAASAGAAQLKAHEVLEPLRADEAAAAAGLHRLEIEQESLDKELERLTREAAQLEDAHAQLIKDQTREGELGIDAHAALEVLEAEAANIRQRIDHERENLATAEARHHEAQALMERAQKTHDDINTEVSGTEGERRGLINTRQSFVMRFEKLKAARDDTQSTLSALEPDETSQCARAEAEIRIEDAARALANAEQQHSDCEAHVAKLVAAEESQRPDMHRLAARLTALRAEAETISRLLQRDIEADSPPVIEEITVEAGYETALAAALGDDLNAPVDENAPVHWSQPADRPAGQRPAPKSPAPKSPAPKSPAPKSPAPESLNSESLNSEALNSKSCRSEQCGSEMSAPGRGEFVLPAPAIALMRFVKAPPELTARLTATGVVTPAEGHRLQSLLMPGQRLVSRQGDMWRWDGYVSRAEAKTAAALRLEQRNRLGELDHEITDAVRQYEVVSRNFEAVKTDLETARRDDRTARAHLRSQEQTHREAQKALAQLEKSQSTAEARYAVAQATLERLKSEIADCERQYTQTDALIAALPDTERLRGNLEAAKAGLTEARSCAHDSRLSYLDLKRDQETRTNRLAAIDTERSSWTDRAARAQARLAELKTRLADTETARQTTRDLPAQIEARRRDLLERLAAAEARRNHAGDRLAAAQAISLDRDKSLRSAEAEAANARETKARLEARYEAAIERVEEAINLARETCDAPPESLLALAGRDIHDDLPERMEIEAQLEKHKAERERLGSVNLRADTEIEEIDARLEEMTAERDDCEIAIRKLRQAISELNKEGRSRLLHAFETVNDHFRTLFVQLFGGGQAELGLVDSDDPLDAGLEIYACPPGKKLTTMSLMSGGEQAMTATALIFAVFMANPAPVCVLDEVDAPLDDANTERFCNMLRGMTETTETRFICITHHALTMSRMDRLFGVTMIEHGVSQLVSVDLSKATELVAAE